MRLSQRVANRGRDAHFPRLGEAEPRDQARVYRRQQFPH